MLRRPTAALCAVLVLPLCAPAHAEESRYRKPPAAIERVLAAPPIPQMFLVPGRAYAALATPLRYPPVADLARPMLRVAGLRIDPSSNGIHHAQAFTNLSWVRIADGKQIAVALPAGAKMSAASLHFSADGSRWAAYNTTARGTELVCGAVGSATVQRVANLSVNATFPAAAAWMPDGVRLVVPALDRQGPPPSEGVARGPVVQETSGKAGELRTYEDLLQSPLDEALFTYYGTSRLMLVDTRNGRITATSARGIFTDVSASPDGTALLTQRVHTPYSYLVPVDAFPEAVEVRDLGGAVSRTITDRALQDHLAEGAVPTGPRDVAWDPNAPHALRWFEALDGGDPATPAPFRDRIVADGTEIARIAQRAVSMVAFDRDPRALVRSYDRDKRVLTTALVDTAHAGAAPLTLFTLRDGDRYNDPGTPLLRSGRNTQSVIEHSGDAIWLRGAGAGPDGLHPFLDRYDVTAKTATRVFRSELSPLENVLAPADDAARAVIVTRQSPVDPPNLVVRTVATGAERALTHVADPAPEVRTIGRRVVRYKRGDGIDLSFTLYTPPGWDGKTPLPTLLWAYPLEFNDRAVASQTTNSAQTFQTIGGISELFMALAGYAVLDNAAIPIVGDPLTVNDTYIDQLTQGAQAAIDEAVRIGATDRSRVAAGGHSYGAFMTANLLAHTRLFKAGIARSGAYNRTLTPFGFQSERRTYWQATDIYTKMSPFTYANQVKDPLLMIHGIADDNSGTFPIQSERFYAAIKGNGGTARLVMLPYEAHGYLGRESVETTLAEMVDWLDRWVKPAH